jgi:hypothetical protein
MSEHIQGRKPIGFVVGGGLKESLQVRLNVPAQEVWEGAFVVIKSRDWLFHGLVTDLLLGSTDPRFADEQSNAQIPAGLADLLHGQTLFTNLEVLPQLMTEMGPDPDSPAYKKWIDEIDAGLREKPRPRPVKTVPAHHADAFLASEGDIAEIFKGDFVIGETREQKHKVYIDLEKFVKRSSGIFGATGTGKSFLTRLLLAGLINHDKASVLVLDMHNEYAFDDFDEDNNPVPGLKNKFGSKVQVVGLGSGTLIRKQQPDFHLEIAMKDIQPEDIELLTRELNLKETTPTTLDALVGSFGRDNWFKAFKAMSSAGTEEDEKGRKIPAPGSVEAWANEAGVHPEAAKALHSKMRKVFNKP